jgi:hypothetical protein
MISASSRPPQEAHAAYVHAAGACISVCRTAPTLCLHASRDLIGRVACRDQRLGNRFRTRHECEADHTGRERWTVNRSDPDCEDDQSHPSITNAEASMWPCHFIIRLASLGWIILTLSAIAQPAPNYQDVPSGDVWIASGATSSFPRGAIEKATSARSETPTGDVWLTTRDVTGTAQLQQNAAEPDRLEIGGVE